MICKKVITEQRRRLPKPDGKDKKVSFKNHTDSIIIVRAVGYFEESDSNCIFNYTELTHFLEPDTTLVVNVHADLIETLYKLKNGN